MTKSVSIVFCLILTASANAMAEATLHIPIFLEGENDSKIPMAKVNEDLKAKGLKEQPTFMEVSTENVDQFDYWGITGAIDSYLEENKIPYNTIFESTPGDYNQGEYVTCYKGNIDEVADFVSGLTDGPYSDQMVFLGAKWGSNVSLAEDLENDSYLKEGSKKWASYDTRSDSVLMLASTTDSGDDIQESVIPPCK